MVMRKTADRPQTKARAGTATTAPKTKAIATSRRATPAESKPQSKRATGTARSGATATAKSGAGTKPRTQRARPQTKPARASEAGDGSDGKEPAIRSMRSPKQIVDAMAKETGQPQTVVRSVLHNLGRQMRRHLRPRGSGKFTIPGLDVTLRRIAKPATKPRQGRNPATGQPITIAAKPTRIVVQARVLKRFREQMGRWRAKTATAILRPG